MTQYDKGLLWLHMFKAIQCTFAVSLEPAVISGVEFRTYIWSRHICSVFVRLRYAIGTCINPHEGNKYIAQQDLMKILSESDRL